jgi:hypothetical protein
MMLRLPIKHFRLSWASANLLGGGCFGIIIQLMLWLKLDRTMNFTSPLFFWVFQILALAVIPGFQALALRQKNTINPWYWLFVSWVVLIIPQFLYFIIFNNFFAPSEPFRGQFSFFGILPIALLSFFISSYESFIILFTNSITIITLAFLQIKSQSQLKNMPSWPWIWQSMIGLVLGDALALFIGFVLSIFISLAGSILRATLNTNWAASDWGHDLMSLVTLAGFFGLRQWMYGLWTTEIIETTK